MKLRMVMKMRNKCRKAAKLLASFRSGWPLHRVKHPLKRLTQVFPSPPYGTHAYPCCLSIVDVSSPIRLGSFHGCLEQEFARPSTAKPYGALHIILDVVFMLFNRVRNTSRHSTVVLIDSDRVIRRPLNFGLKVKAGQRNS